MAISTTSLLVGVTAVTGIQFMAAGDLRQAMAQKWFLHLFAGAQIAGVVAHLAFAFFLRGIGTVFNEPFLSESATKYIVFQVASAVISLPASSLFWERHPDSWLVAGVFAFNIVQSLITVGWFMYLTRSTADCIES